MTDKSMRRKTRDVDTEKATRLVGTFPPGHRAEVNAESGELLIYGPETPDARVADARSTGMTAAKLAALIRSRRGARPDARR